MFMFSRHSKLAALFDSFQLCALSALSVPAMAKKLSKQISLWSLKKYAKPAQTEVNQVLPATHNTNTEKPPAPGRQKNPSKQHDSTVALLKTWPTPDTDSRDRSAAVAEAMAAVLFPQKIEPRCATTQRIQILKALKLVEMVCFPENATRKIGF